MLLFHTKIEAQKYATYIELTRMNLSWWLCHQAFFPLGPFSQMIYGGLAAIIFSGYIVYDTDNLIKRYSYDEYIWASVALYLDVVNLFMAILQILRSFQSNN